MRWLAMHERAPILLSWAHLAIAGTIGAATMAAVALCARERSPAAPSQLAVAAAPIAAAAVPADPAPTGAPPRTADAADDNGHVLDTLVAVGVPCVDRSTQLVSDGRSPILCWGDHCRAFESEHGVEGVVDSPSPPAPVEQAPRVTDAHGGFDVCTGDHCTRVGPRLAAALTAARAAGAQEQADGEWEVAAAYLFEASATRDHGIVMFHGPGQASAHPTYGPQAWDVARDRRIALRPPRSCGRDDAFLVGLAAVGNQLVASWSADVWPCSRAIVVDRDGHNRGREFAAGSLVQQTLDHFVVLGENGTMTAIDHGHATAAGSLETSGGTTIRLDDHRIAALVADHWRWRIVIITDGVARTTRTFDSCQDPS